MWLLAAEDTALRHRGAERRRRRRGLRRLQLVRCGGRPAPRRRLGSAEGRRRWRGPAPGGSAAPQRVFGRAGRALAMLGAGDAASRFQRQRALFSPEDLRMLAGLASRGPRTASSPSPQPFAGRRARLCAGCAAPISALSRRWLDAEGRRHLDGAWARTARAAPGPSYRGASDSPCRTPCIATPTAASGCCVRCSPAICPGMTSCGRSRASACDGRLVRPGFRRNALGAFARAADRERPAVCGGHLHLLAEHRDGRRDHGERLFALVMLEEWLRGERRESAA